MTTDLTQIVETFALLDDWEEKYKYLIELGSYLEPLPVEYRCNSYKVSGCASQVWLVPNITTDKKLNFKADSDAHTVKGLLFLTLTFYNGKTLNQAKQADIKSFLNELELNNHISVQRSNGLNSVITQIKQYIVSKEEK